MTLIEECLECLGDNVYVFEYNEKNNIREKFFSLVPLTKWGRIDWNKFKDKRKLTDKLQLDLNENYYIIWTDYTTPILKTTLKNIINNLDDVLSVSFDTWLLSEDEKLVIEFYHDDSDIIIGNISDVTSFYGYK